MKVDKEFYALGYTTRNNKHYQTKYGSELPMCIQYVNESNFPYNKYIEIWTNISDISDSTCNEYSFTIRAFEKNKLQDKDITHVSEDVLKACVNAIQEIKDMWLKQ